MKVFVETEPLLKYPAGIAVYLNRLYGELSALQKEITLYTGFQGADRQVRADWKNAVQQYMPEQMINIFQYFYNIVLLYQ